MRRVLAWVAFAIAALCAPTLASDNAGQQLYHIAADDRLVTDVYIDGHGPFTFLIDSASSRTMIFEHVRAVLGIAYSSPDPMTVYGINDVMSARAVMPGVVTAAGVSIHGLTLGVLPDAAQKGDPDGVLGLDVLAKYFVVLDRNTMQFRLLDRASPAADAYRQWPSVSMTLRPLKNLPVSMWFLRARYNDHAISTLFDLGAGLTLVNWNAAQQMGFRRKEFDKYGPPPDQVRDVLGKEAPAVVLRDATVTLSAGFWHDQDVLISNAQVFDFLNLSDNASAIAGPGLLKNNPLAIDFQADTLYVGPAVPPG